MELKHIKLRTGEDLVAPARFIKDKVGYQALEVTTPVSIHMDPNLGFYAKSWLLLSKDNTVILNLEDVMFCKPASDTAEEYYNEFVYKYSSETQIDEDTSELEELFTTMLESKTSIKH